MCGIFTYIWAIFGVNVGNYSIHMEHLGYVYIYSRHQNPRRYTPRSSRRHLVQVTGDVAHSGPDQDPHRSPRNPSDCWEMLWNLQPPKKKINTVDIWWFPYGWRYPKWLVYHGKSHLEMDDDWGYRH